MIDKLRLYISAAPDLRFERDLLARSITEVPTSLGWTIHQTPGPEREPDLDAVARADVHVLMIGSDIQAPVGLEWVTARRLGRGVSLLYKASIPQTQAAQAFVRDLARHGKWVGFDDAADLRKRVMRLLVDHILANTARYDIHANEVARLRDWRKSLDAMDKKGVDERRGGAEASAVILTDERFVPSEGRLLHGPGTRGDAD
jgi:hypothetical protein